MLHVLVEKSPAVRRVSEKVLEGTRGRLGTRAAAEAGVGGVTQSRRASLNTGWTTDQIEGKLSTLDQLDPTPSPTPEQTRRGLN